jgi:hypothetical protein
MRMLCDMFKGLGSLTSLGLGNQKCTKNKNKKGLNF